MFGSTKKSGSRASRKAAGAPLEPIALVALDVDGTLLRTDKSLTARSVKAIQQAIRQEVRIVLASARPPRSTRDIYTHLKLTTLQINYNGALILDQTTNRVIHHQPMAPSLVKRIIAFARKLDPAVAVSMEILDRWLTDRVDYSLPTETSRVFSPDLVGPIDQIIQSPVTKLMLLDQPQRLDHVRRAVQKQFSRSIAIAVSDPHLIQITHRDVDKGAALAVIAEHYGVPRQRIMAVGDAPNDVGMLKYAGLAVAVENAWPDVLEVADAVVPTNNDDGVAIALERFVLMS